MCLIIYNICLFTIQITLVAYNFPKYPASLQNVILFLTKSYVFQFIWKCLNFPSNSLQRDLFTLGNDGKVNVNFMTQIQPNPSSLPESGLDEFISFGYEGYLQGESI